MRLAGLPLPPSVCASSMPNRLRHQPVCSPGELLAAEGDYSRLIELSPDGIVDALFRRGSIRDKVCLGCLTLHPAVSRACVGP